MLSGERLFVYAFIYRLANLCFVQTSFVPDEYWQSIEPAHHLVFGYGNLPWEWNRGLRNYLYPLIFAGLYKAMSLFQLDSCFLIVMFPRFLHCLLAAVSDVYLYKLAKLLYGEKPAFWTILCYWLNWFVFYCATRTLANTVEAQLTIIALYYYPWPPNYLFDRQKRPANESVYLVIVALATVIRPTSVVFWGPLCVWHMFRSRRRLFAFVLIALEATLPVFLLSVAVDRFCYGEWVVSLWRFLQFNVLEGGSAHFGVNSWHWYVSNCIPTIFLTQIILICYGIIATKDWTILSLCSFYIFVHSFLAHKELRFLLPIMSPMLIYAGRYIEITYRRCSKYELAHDDGAGRKEDDDRDPFKRRPTFTFCDYIKWAPKRVNALIAFLFLSNLPVIIYTGLFHQRGVLDVAGFLHDEYAFNRTTTNRSMVVWYLTPCYTGPGHSHVHAPIQLRTLDCSPNLNGSRDYVDEADRFHANPAEWIERELVDQKNSSSSSLPTHVVLYDWLWRKVAEEPLRARGYRICGRFYNTDFPQSARQSKYLFVACLR